PIPLRPIAAYVNQRRSTTRPRLNEPASHDAKSKTQLSAIRNKGAAGRHNHHTISRSAVDAAATRTFFGCSRVKFAAACSTEAIGVRSAADISGCREFEFELTQRSPHHRLMMPASVETTSVSVASTTHPRFEPVSLFDGREGKNWESLNFWHA